MKLEDRGYDKEEEYFYKKNKELIEQKRSELDARRAEREAEKLRTRHWMRCPKCGHEMEEVEMAGLKVDRCTECDGLYFDAGELELLLESKESEGFLGGLRRLFR